MEKKHNRQLGTQNIRIIFGHLATEFKELFKLFFGFLKKGFNKIVPRLDRYLIFKFIGTYVFSILLIISVAVVFDVNENLSKFAQYNAPMKAIVFDYYMNFVPYYANLFSPLFVFIAVIFFTSNLAGHSEFIAMLAAGISFKRLLRPYMISAALISILSFCLGGYIIPRGTVVRQNFERLYKNSYNIITSSENVQIQVQPGVIAYMQHYDRNYKKAYGFCLDKFEGKKLVNHLTATEAQYDTISDTKFKWKLYNWRNREMKGLREKITSGPQKDTIITIEPNDLVYSKGMQETYTNPELKEYIQRQYERGSGSVAQYEVEYHKRIASSFAAFILTIIGASLSAKKRKGGMGLYLGIGLALSCAYIMLQTVSSTLAVNSGWDPMLAAWMPNILFAFIAYFCYRKAPN
ncbi:MAG: LptF/LptG family permease [Bacteroidaceae bacterium]|nr:LptF/LptG family permease [Bacteroidaceae bacterium]